MSIIIDKEFQTLLPPLSPDEFKQLEENCVKDGIRDALIVWKQPDGNDILIDGHNRWNISVRHGGIPFQIKRMEFLDRGAAKLWVFQNQLGRRNLNAFIRSEVALEAKPIIVEKAKENQRASGGAVPQKSAKPVDTRQELAKIAGVSHDTIHKVEVIKNSGDKELIRQVRDGETTINRAYMTVKGIEPYDKSMRQMKQEQLKQAKQEHADFQQQKVVDFSDIAKDKENRKRIAKSLYSELLGLGKRIEEVSIRNKEKDIDIKGMSAMLTHEERKLLLDMIGIWRTQLTQIAQEVTGN
jgi:hypothetical protein